MEYKHLTRQELEILRELFNGEEITERDLPLGLTIGGDSMGPFRNSRTDTLHESVVEVLREFGDTIQQYNLSFAVTTNGPNKEGEEIINAFGDDPNILVYAITEGGGNVIYRDNGELIHRRLANRQELDDLNSLEGIVKADRLMKTLLENTQSDDGEASIRTPYDTMMVLTIPNDYETLVNILNAKGISQEELENTIPGIQEDHVGELLNYANNKFGTAIADGDMKDSIADPTVNTSNRRIYVGVKHTYDGRLRNKSNGTVTGSEMLRASKGFPLYTRSYSAYIADLIAVETDEGKILGASERSMVKDDVDQSKLAFNVTLDDKQPSLEYVQGVKILNIRELKY